jgi:endo-alpha-1,4-polygalactosaminidase (GH114 family)
MATMMKLRGEHVRPGTDELVFSTGLVVSDQARKRENDHHIAHTSLLFSSMLKNYARAIRDDLLLFDDSSRVLQTLRATLLTHLDAAATYETDFTQLTHQTEQAAQLVVAYTALETHAQQLESVVTQAIEAADQNQMNSIAAILQRGKRLVSFQLQFQLEGI